MFKIKSLTFGTLPSSMLSVEKINVVIHSVNYHFYNREEAEKYDKVLMLADTPFDKMICNNLMVFNL